MYLKGDDYKLVKAVCRVPPDVDPECISEGLDCTTNGDCCNGLSCIPIGLRPVCAEPLVVYLSPRLTDFDDTLSLMKHGSE